MSIATDSIILVEDVWDDKLLKKRRGARISTGRDSKQDYQSPSDFMEAVVGRFGPITFDLAAHAGNAQSPNYFAPCTGPDGPLPRDPRAFGIDAFDHPWAHLSTNRFRRMGEHGLLWLNCEWSDIASWAAKCRDESLCEAGLCGANILLLTPAAVGSVWFSDLIVPYADTYLLRPRLEFIPGQSFNRDCMLSHFVDPRVRSQGRYAVRRAPSSEFRSLEIWNWKTDKTIHQWLRAA
jgi:hypothetical protein